MLEDISKSSTRKKKIFFSRTNMILTESDSGSPALVPATKGSIR